MALTFVIAIAIFLGLLLFLYKETQRSPGPKAWGRTPRWPKRIRVALATVPLILAGLGIWAVLIEPNRLVVRHQTIRIDNWPSGLNGLKVAVISDIHAGGWFIDEDKLRLIVERTNQLQPDFIVILGDYMTGDSNTSHAMDPEIFASILKGFVAPQGVYSVLGNHDWWSDGNRVRRALEANGIKVLEDEVTEVKFNGASFWVAGLADLWTRPQRIDQTIGKIPGGPPVIALTHNPDIFPNVPSRVSLLLAGHSHGGQVRLPFIGPVVESNRSGDRYLRGVILEQGHHMFVTTGIGTSIMPLRFGVPPEIVLLTVVS